MLRLRSEPAAPLVATAVAPVTPAPAVAAPTTEPRFADYLVRIDAALRPHLAADARASVLRELAQHLEASRAAFAELGETPEQAVESALARFGDPAVVAARFRRALLRPTPGAVRPAFRLALRAAGATFAFAVALMLGGDAFAWLDIAAAFLVMLAPLPLGVYVGARAGGRAGLGTFYALALLAFALSPVGVAALWAEPLSQNSLNLTLLVVAVGVWWLGAASLTAAATAGACGWVRRRRRVAAG